MSTVEKVARIFHGFEETDEADRQAYERMTPEQHVEAFLSIQQRSYPNGLDERLARVLSSVSA